MSEEENVQELIQTPPRRTGKHQNGFAGMDSELSNRHSQG